MRQGPRSVRIAGPAGPVLRLAPERARSEEGGCEDHPAPHRSHARGGTLQGGRQRSTSPRMNASTAFRASLSLYCTGGLFMK